MQRAAGKDVWLRFTDAAEKVRTWRGDWRAPVDENVTTPDDFRVIVTKISQKIHGE